MGKFVCMDCGHIFDEEEVAIWNEDRGEYWGTQCHEEMRGCPRCYGSYVKAYKCDLCDEYIDGDYMKSADGQRYCMDCLTPMSLGDEH